jgi:hypothetical protein
MSKAIKVAVAGCVVCALIVVSRDWVAASQATGSHAHASACAEACSSCSNTCSSCSEHCLMLVGSGKKEHLVTVRLCNDCADVCSIAAQIESRQGPLRVLVCDACAKACDICTAECEKYKDDQHMADCAKACKKCAEACREMIQLASRNK